MFTLVSLNNTCKEKWDAVNVNEERRLLRNPFLIENKEPHLKISKKEIKICLLSNFTQANLIGNAAELKEFATPQHDQEVVALRLPMA